MSRASSAIPEPTPGRVERVVDVQVGTLHRVVGNRHDQPWWFSSRDRSAAGRFDLTDGRGTCYWAETPLTALLERFTDPDDLDTLVPASAVEATRVWTHETPPPGSAADTTHATSGLAKEIGTGTDYEACWQWADALDADGREAVRYWSRMDPEANRSVAVFGPASTPEDSPDPALWPAGSSTSSSGWLDVLIERGIAAYGPALGALDRATPPEI